MHFPSRIPLYLNLPLTIDPAEVAMHSPLIIRPYGHTFRARTCPHTTACLLVKAMDIIAATLVAQGKSRPHRSRNPNVFYYKPIEPLFSRGCVDKASEVSENTSRHRGCVPPLATNPCPELVH